MMSAGQMTPATATDVVRGYRPGVVVTAHGPIEVPEKPARVVTLSEYALDTAVAVGVTPVGAIASAGHDGVAPYIADQVPDITVVGRAGQIDVKVIRALEPDLILASWQTDDALYAELSAMAPTIVPPDITEPGFDELRGWEYDVLVYAHALGRSDEAAVQLEATHKRAKAIRNDAASVVNDQRAVVVQWTSDGPLPLTTGTFSSVQLYRAGFSPVDGVLGTRISPDDLAALDADWLFIAPLGADGEAAYREAAEGLDLGETRVVVVDGAVWTSAAGPIAANLTLDDIEHAID
jgi:iron complex transport system substrate-binding protein